MAVLQPPRRSARRTRPCFQPLSTCGTTQGGGGELTGPSVPPCIVPHVEAGWSRDRARRALRRGGYSTVSKRVRSATVAKGRVVRLSEPEGAVLKARETVVIRVSGGR